MAYRDLSLVQKKFAMLDRRREEFDEKRNRSTKAGMLEEAEGFFLEYANTLSYLEWLARQLGYQDYDAARADVRRIWSR